MPRVLIAAVVSQMLYYLLKAVSSGTSLINLDHHQHLHSVPFCAPITSSLQISTARGHYRILVTKFIAWKYAPFPNLNSVASSFSSDSSSLTTIFYAF